MADCRGFCGVPGKRAATMGCILRAHVGTLEFPKQEPWSVSREGGINLEENDGKVRSEGGGSGVKGGV